MLTWGLQIRQASSAFGSQIRASGSNPIRQAFSVVGGGFGQHAIYIASPQGLQAVCGDLDQGFISGHRRLLLSLSAQTARHNPGSRGYNSGSISVPHAKVNTPAVIAFAAAILAVPVALCFFAAAVRAHLAGSNRHIVG
jgi:hypothetical protein